MSHATSTPRGQELCRLGPLVVLIGFGALALISDFRHHGLGYLSGVGLAFVGLALTFAHYRNLDQSSEPPGSESDQRVPRLSLGVVLGVAVAARVLVLIPAPSLSDDIYRYLWDGRVVVSGENPYRLAPASPELASLRDDIWRQTAHRDVPTVYPPAALAMFSIATLLPEPIVAYRVILLLFDVVSCVLLWKLAERFQIARSRTVLYAWNPLVILEGVGSGHVDLIGVTFVLWALLSLSRLGRDHGEGQSGVHDASQSRGHELASLTVWAGLATALGILTKLVPVVVAPFWWVLTRRSIGYASTVCAILLVTLLPVVWWTGGVPPGLVTYGVSWEFNGPLYEPLWRALDVAGVDAAAKWLLQSVEHMTGAHEALDPLFRYLYPQLLAKLVLGLALIVIVWRGMKSVDLLAGSRWVLGGALLCSATLYPWYVLWIVPLAALTLSPFWLVLTVTMQFAYLPRLVGLELFPWVFVMVWLPPTVAAFAWRRLRDHASRLQDGVMEDAAV